MYAIDYKYKYRWSLDIEICQRKSSSSMGRFGGGWNWELGFELGGHTLILNLLVLYIVVSIEKKL